MTPISPSNDRPARSQAALIFVLALASAVAVGMLVLRAMWGGGTGYLSLAWNLFLAWVPYGLGLWLCTFAPTRRRDWLAMAGVATLWLLFFPNAPYLIT